MSDKKHKTVEVTALWLRSAGGETPASAQRVELLAEIDGVWHLVASEYKDAPFGIIIEARGVKSCRIDPLTTPPANGASDE